MRKNLLFILLLFIANISFGQTTGDYRSTSAAGDWSSASTAVWQVYNGTTWVTAAAYPNNTTTPVPSKITIVAPATSGTILRVLLNATQGNLPNTNLVIEDGAIVQIGYNQRFPYALYIKDLIINAGGTFTVSTTGELAGATFNQPIRTQEVRINNSLIVNSGNGTVNPNPAKFIGTYTFANTPTAAAPETSYTQRFTGYIGNQSNGAGTFPAASANIVYPAASQTFNNSTNGASTVATWNFYGTTLPLTLVDFDAKLNLNTTIVNWITVSELNTDKFEIEKSTNGENFTLCGTVPAKNTNTRNSYSFIDKYPANGVAYYRLKMIDIDGTFTYSGVKFVNNKLVVISVYPNPASKILKVGFPNVQVKGNISILNMTGAVISKISLEKETSSTNINIQDLANGTYIINMEIDGAVFSKKFIKIN